MPREGGYMLENIIALVICFVLGVGISALNYMISKKVLLKHANKYQFVTIVRQIIQVTFLVALYAAGVLLDINAVYTLVGGALGNTISMFFFTKRLLDINRKVEEAQKNG